VPTWKFPGKDPVEGFLTLTQISAKSGVPLPVNIVSIDTNQFDFEIELLPDAAPLTVAIS